MYAVHIAWCCSVYGECSQGEAWHLSTYGSKLQVHLCTHCTRFMLIYGGKVFTRLTCLAEELFLVVKADACGTRRNIEQKESGIRCELAMCDWLCMGTVPLCWVGEGLQGGLCGECSPRLHQGRVGQQPRSDVQLNPHPPPAPSRYFPTITLKHPSVI